MLSALAVTLSVLFMQDYRVLSRNGNFIVIFIPSNQADVWSRTRRSIDVMVAPDRLRHARETAEEHGIASKVVIDDVQR